MSTEAWVLAGFVVGVVTGVAFAIHIVRNRRARRRTSIPEPYSAASLSPRHVEPVYTPSVSTASPASRRHDLPEVEITEAIGRTTSVKVKLAGGAAMLIVLATAAYRAYATLYGAPAQAIASATPVQIINENHVSIDLAEELRRHLDSVRIVQGEGYEIRRHYRQNMVEDMPGTWYEIDIRNAKRTGGLFFEPGKYKLDEAEDASLKEVMKRVQREVFKVGMAYHLFVRGTADLLGADAAVVDSLHTNSSLRVRYLPRKPSDPNIYQNIPRDTLIPVHFNNQHLPNLRGNYMQERLRDANLTAEILDGRVSRRISAEDRNVEVFLFLPSTP